MAIRLYLPCVDQLVGICIGRFFIHNDSLADSKLPIDKSGSSQPREKPANRISSCCLQTHLQPAVDDKTVKRRINITEYRLAPAAAVYRIETGLPGVGKILEVDEQGEPFPYLFSHESKGPVGLARPSIAGHGINSLQTAG